MQEDLELVNKKIEALRACGTHILVEGKRDAAALRRLGFSQISTINTHLDEVSQHLASHVKACAILTDLDPAGRRLHARLSRDLQALGVTVDDRLRLALLTSSRLRHIEGLDSYARGCFLTQFMYDTILPHKDSSR